MASRVIAACLVLPSCVWAQTQRPFDIADLLQVERLGAATVTPDDRRLVLQWETGVEKAARHDSDGFSTAYTGRIRVIDLKPPYAVRDFAPAEPGIGYVAGPLAPDGERLLLSGFRGGIWSASIAHLSTGALTPLDLAIDLPILGRSAQWIDSGRLIAITRAPGRAPSYVESMPHTKARLTRLWEAAAEGGASYQVVGNGPGLHWPAGSLGALVEVDLSTRATTRLASGDFHDVEVAPDGHWVAALEAGDARGLRPEDHIEVATTSRRNSLLLIHRETGAAWRPLLGLEVLPLMLAWSPSGAQLMVLAQGEDQRPGLWVVEPNRRRARRIVEGADLVTRRVGAGFVVAQAVWYEERALVATRGQDRGDVRWKLFDAETSLDVFDDPDWPLTEILSSNGSSVSLSGPRGQLTISASSQPLMMPDTLGRAVRTPDLGQGLRFEIAPLAGHALVRTPEGLARLTQDGRRPVAAISPDASVVAIGSAVAIVRDRDERGVSQIHLAGGDAQTRLFTLNEHLADTAPMQVIKIPHMGHQGQELTSWYVAPEAPTGRRPPPLLILPYPGAAYSSLPPMLRGDAWAPTPHARLLSAAGYAVLVPALPPLDSSGEPGRAIGAQIEAALDATLALGLADPSRVALWGHSFGGYGALIAATQSPRFQAVIAQAAKTDLTAGWSAIAPFPRLTPEAGPGMIPAIGWSESGQGGLGAPPWREPARYWRNSPVARVEDINAPVLLIHGDHDFVPLAQAEALFAALYRLGRPVGLMTLFGEGHLPGSPANIRGIYETVLSWLPNQFSTTGTRSADYPLK